MPRLTLDLSEEIDSRLAEIATAESITKSEAMRRALALLSVAQREKSKGNTLGVIKENEKHETIVVGRLVGI